MWLFRYDKNMLPQLNWDSGAGNWDWDRMM